MLAVFLLLLRLAAPGQPPAQPAPPAGLPELLQRATAYVADYVKALTSIVTEERYDQRLRQRGDANSASVVVTRTLVSDYLMVVVPGSRDWLPFRDVYSVDGRPIRDRTDRLLTLLTSPSAGAMQQALRIRDEASRFNLGSGFRDINVPTFALQILSEDNRPGFAFSDKGRDRAGGVDAAVIEFIETARPTLIVGAQGEDVPARGRFWIEPSTGRVIQTRLETRPKGASTRIEVQFREDTRLGLWVPGQMDERRVDAAGTLEGHATYSNVRRFRVDTTIDVK